jgi:hypothetical protein
MLENLEQPLDSVLSEKPWAPIVLQLRLIRGLYPLHGSLAKSAKTMANRLRYLLAP